MVLLHEGLLPGEQWMLGGLLEANVEEEARALDTDRATRDSNAVDLQAWSKV